MIRHLLIVTVPLFWITGVSLSKSVSQSPSALLVKPNTSVTLNCSHKIPSYDTILWYQRSVGDTALNLIAYTNYKTPTVEPPYKGLGLGTRVVQTPATLVTTPGDSADLNCSPSTKDYDVIL
ncbi:hypothetical protein J4Q44_G00254690 [Coregonus suidteri]|uniref:Ig-like domain-containing protein n=1 Tax=Coregonus suidteri TaxID=861788 RepID=A0AAN8L8N4_9TELE